MLKHLSHQDNDESCSSLGPVHIDINCQDPRVRGETFGMLLLQVREHIIYILNEIKFDLIIEESKTVT